MERESANSSLKGDVQGDRHSNSDRAGGHLREEDAGDGATGDDDIGESDSVAGKLYQATKDRYVLGDVDCLRRADSDAAGGKRPDGHFHTSDKLGMLT